MRQEGQGRSEHHDLSHMGVVVEGGQIQKVMKAEGDLVE